MRRTLKINSVVCKCRLVCTLMSRHLTKILVITGEQLFFNRVFTLESKKWLLAPLSLFGWSTGTLSGLWCGKTAPLLVWLLGFGDLSRIQCHTLNVRFHLTCALRHGVLFKLSARDNMIPALEGPVIFKGSLTHCRRQKNL